MANGHGGKRCGAGRPKKPLAEKILCGNPGKRALTVLEFKAPELEVPDPPEYLADMAAGEGSCPGAKEIHEKTVGWLETTGCLHLVNPEFLSEYSVLKARWLSCEAKNRSGLLSRHPTTGQAIPSPFVRLGLDYLRAADAAWSKIWAVVSRNSERGFDASPNDDVMERLLAVRK